MKHELVSLRGGTENFSSESQRSYDYICIYRYFITGIFYCLDIGKLEILRGKTKETDTRYMTIRKT